MFDPDADSNKRLFRDQLARQQGKTKGVADFVAESKKGQHGRYVMGEKNGLRSVYYQGKVIASERRDGSWFNNRTRKIISQKELKKNYNAGRNMIRKLHGDKIADKRQEQIIDGALAVGSVAAAAGGAVATGGMSKALWAAGLAMGAASAYRQDDGLQLLPSIAGKLIRGKTGNMIDLSGSVYNAWSNNGGE